jgi:transcriptional regulator with XRE-family HTH domain
VPRTRIDIRKLYASLDAARQGKGLSWRQLAGEIGVSPSTMTRMANNNAPHVDAFVALVRWLKMPAETFMTDEDDGQADEQPELMAQVAALLRARQDLSPDEVNYLQEVLAVAMRRFTDERASRAR